ncbi:phage Gp37/Gp68 family protein [Planctomycetales bacterium ZRK34]|nr:phage Gp37/Gp68 family protein [Planctomycetales bacterium ZRK34]
MSQTSTIEWTDTTWNPVVGCTKVSAGCKHCYAERMAKRLSHVAEAAEKRGGSAGRTHHYLKVINNRGRWNGKVGLVDEAVEDPYRWKSPRMVFVNSMSDLFHEDVPLDFIQRVFRSMNDNPQHTFQILTKRPHLAAQFASQLNWTPNIWMGTSVENALVRHRIADLRKINAHIRFLSLEPLLGPLPRLNLRGIHWAIVGGESGPGARPMDPTWVRQLRDRCRNNNIAFFFKQWGGVNKKSTGRELDGELWDQMPFSFLGESGGTTTLRA